MLWILLLIILALIIFFIVNFFSQRKILKIFKQGNCSVTGLRGTGKDMLFCFIINKRKENYISNIQYSNPNKKFKRFDFSPKVWELAKNTNIDFIENTVTPYTYPYPDGIDYYISDCGVYFPSQYHSYLEKKYPSTPLFQALSRHLGDCNVHTNSQRLGRVWDKMREQSDLYIGLRHCKVFPLKIVHISMYVYDSEESAQKLIKKPFFGLGSKARDRKALFTSTHGEIRKISFFFKLKYNYDSRRFKKILENDCVDYEVSE